MSLNYNFKNMRKQFVLFLILIFILGLVPTNFLEAITQNQINAEVQIVCPDSYGNWFSGSGTIIDPKGIVLTNKHVVSDKYGGIIKTCFIGFIESISQEPNFGTKGSYNLADVKYYTTTEDMDAAILYLNNDSNKIYPHIDIWNSNSSSLQFGDKVEVIGFPSIGGSTITYTSGDFSGFGSSNDGTQNYIKTTAPLEHGNSGGASYNSNGLFVGIPSMVVAGSLNSISYILSSNSVKNWLSTILGNNYQNKVIEQKPDVIKPTVDIQEDVTPPYFDTGWFEKFYLCDDKSSICNKVGSDSQIVGTSNKIFIQTTSKIISLMDSKSRTVGVYYNYSKNLPDLNEKNEVSYTLSDYKYWPEDYREVKLIDNNGKEFTDREPYEENIPISNWITLSSVGTYYFGLRFVDKNGNVSNRNIFSYTYQWPINNSDNKAEEKKSATQVDEKLVNKLKGKILLQVESRGEAWYVNPKNGQRYYMADGNEAYKIMRFLGTGITSKDLNKMKSDKNFAKKNSGKIFLQVEANGEAYYIDFNGNAHYLRDGSAAYTAMRELGLGITNNDLSKIPEGSL